MVYQIRLRPDLSQVVARHADVTDGRIETARRISRRARAGTSGRRAKRSHRVEVDRSGQGPPFVAAAAGAGGPAGDAGFIYVFEEFGGEGFRPPRAPLRTAAESIAGGGR